MGKIALETLGNIFGWTAGIFAFFANLPNPLSIIIGIGSGMFIYYRVLDKREDVLTKRQARKEREYQFNRDNPKFNTKKQ